MKIKILSHCDLTPVWISDISDKSLRVEGQKKLSKSPMFPLKVQPVVFSDGIRYD